MINITLKELCTILKTAKTLNDINQFKDKIHFMIPTIDIMFDYDQNNHAHQYDLWTHSLYTVLNLPRNLDDDMLYLAALLHDIGKPFCRCKGKNPNDTNSHYFGHPEKSYEIVKEIIIPCLIFVSEQYLTDEEQNRLLYYILYHDDRVSLRVKHLRRHLKITDLDTFKKLMLLEVADAKAHILEPVIEERIRICSLLSGDYADELKKQIDNGI